MTTSQQLATATSPVAFLPELRVGRISLVSPAAQPAVGRLRLTPAGCAPTPSSPRNSSSSTAAANCSGFQFSTDSNFSAARTVSTVFSPTAVPLRIEPFARAQHTLANVTLSNGGGVVLPADAGAPLISGIADVTVAVPGLNQPSALSLPFRVMWSPGGAHAGAAAPPGTVDLFALVIKAEPKHPAPVADFKLAVAQSVTFNMRIRLVGFLPAEPGTTGVSVLGDWGQPPPAAGVPGPRVVVRTGSTAARVRLVAEVTNLDNPNSGSSNYSTG